VELAAILGDVMADAGWRELEEPDKVLLARAPLALPVAMLGRAPCAR
jgi:hypothetical protein